MNSEKIVDEYLQNNKNRTKKQLEDMERDKEFFYNSYLGE